MKYKRRYGGDDDGAPLAEPQNEPQKLEQPQEPEQPAVVQVTTEKSGPLIASRNGAIQYAIAISIFLLGVLLIVLAWAIPSMTTQNSIIFTVIGFLIFLLGMMHIIAIPTMFA